MKKKSIAIGTAVFLLMLASMSCYLGVPGKRDPLKISPDSLPNALVGVAYSAGITVTENGTPAGDIYISKGELPPGLEFEKTPGEDAATITGIPTTAGAYTFTVHVWCYGTNSSSGQLGDLEYTLVVE